MPRPLSGISWQTVLASGAFSALIGGGIALAGQRWQREYERDEAMRTRRIDAADAYIQAINEAIAVVRGSYETAQQVADVREKFDVLRTQAIIHSRRVSLLFGPDSPAYEAAEALHASLSRLGTALGSSSESFADAVLWEAVKAAVDKTNESNKRFVVSARLQVAPAERRKVWAIVLGLGNGRSPPNE